MSKCLRIGRLHIHRHERLETTFQTCVMGNGREVMVGAGPFTAYWTGDHNYDIGCGEGGVTREGD